MQLKASHPLDVIIGSQLRLQRKMMGLSQSALAKRMGITFQQVQKYERGSNSMSARRLFEVAQILQVSPMYFYAGPHSGDEYPPVDMLNTQAIHLMQDFTAITSDKVRHSIAAFVRAIAKETKHGL